MKTTEKINGKEITIFWEVGEMLERNGRIESHLLNGKSEDGREFSACGDFCDDELIEIKDIEEFEVAKQ